MHSRLSQGYHICIGVYYILFAIILYIACLIGGRELKIDLGALPVQTKISADDKIQIGINVVELAKKDKDWFSTLKKMNKNNFSKYLVEAYKDDTKGEIKPKFNVMGYL
ncbi:MAG: hypothetical protein K2I53_01480 [Lachnospiraceae bacterium]|nr:hypothetical protein [Lachnospiraceae bacterium]